LHLGNGGGEFVFAGKEDVFGAAGEVSLVLLGEGRRKVFQLRLLAVTGLDWQLANANGIIMNRNGCTCDEFCFHRRQNV
jgi:predicted secreted protein